MRFILCLGLLVLVSVRPAFADDIPGQSAPAFQAAVAGWLADNEAEALPELARLAREGNAAAQMLLALIDKTPALQGPWLARIPRGDRIGMMRAPGGISGLSWMREAASQVPLAAMWLKLWSVESRASLAINFARLGEARAARETVATLVSRERRVLSDIATDPDFPRALRYLVWHEWQSDPDMHDAIAAERAALSPDDPQHQMMSSPADPEALARWLLEAPEAAGIATLCTAQCPGSAPDCARALQAALGSYASLVTFGTPSERLIPADAFNESPRGQGALLRRVLLNADARGRRAQITRARQADACLGDLLEAEAQRYMPQREPAP